MRFLAVPSIVLFLSVFCPPNTQGYHDRWGLMVSPSARINGMGEAGVATVAPQSAWYNPASLGFLADTYRFTGSFFPIRSHYLGDLTRDRNLQFLTATGGLVRQQGLYHSPVSVGVSVHRTDLFVPGFWEESVRSTVDAVSLGISRTGEVSLGVGVTYRSVGISTFSCYYDSRIEGDAVDFGLMLGLTLWPRQVPETTGRDGLWVPFKLGMVWNNLAGSLTRLDGVEVGSAAPEEVRRTGLSLGMIYTSGGLEDISALLAFEYEEVLSSDRWPRPRLHLGIELAIMQMVTLRAGHVGEDGADGNFSTGFTLSTRGLTRRPANDPSGSLLSKLALDFSAAYNPEEEDTPLSRSKYYSIDISWLY